MKTKLMSGLLALFPIAVHPQSVTLGWDPSSTPAVTYSLYQSVGNAAFSRIQYGLTTTKATATANTTNQTRWFVTAMLGSLESVPSNVLTNTPTPPPDPPTAPGTPFLTYLNRINGNRIDGGIGTKDLTSLTQVWRQMDDGPWQLWLTLQPGDLHWSDTNAQQRKSWSYKVTSCNRYGCSPFSQVSTWPAKQ